MERFNFDEYRARMLEAGKDCMRIEKEEKLKLAAQEAAAKAAAEIIPPVQKAQKMLATAQKTLAEIEIGHPLAFGYTVSALNQSVAAMAILADEVATMQNATTAE